MSKKRKRGGGLRYEFGDCVLWVAFGDDDPFPVDIYRKGEKVVWKTHPRRALTTDERRELGSFLAQRSNDLQALWPDSFTERLNWPPLPRPTEDEPNDDDA